MRALALATAAAVGVAAISGGESSAREAPEAGKRPNIVVVMTDDQDQASMAMMPTVQSELVAHGATFPNNFTNWPLCCPSRATFYSGQYAHNHGVLANGPPDGGYVAFDHANALPVWLREAGYRTIHVGKYINGYGLDDPAAVPPGWDEWYAAIGGGASTQAVYGYPLNQNGVLVDYGITAADFKQDVFTGLAVDAIYRNAPAGPFFLGVMYTAPHSGGPDPNPQPPSDCAETAKPAPRHAGAFDSAPLPRPPSFNEADVSDKPLTIRSQRPLTAADVATIRRHHRCRLESLLSVDNGVARILQALRAVGELDRTLVVFTSDNGYFAGEHRVRLGKNRVYDEAARVPLVIRGPGVPQGVAVEDLASNADLAPTILDAADAAAGRVVDGRSLLPLAAHPIRFGGRELLLEKGDVVDRVADPAQQAGTFAAVRTSRYLYVENLTGELELYDLDLDPDLLRNEIANPAYDAAEAALAARLAPLRSCAGKTCRRPPDLSLSLSRPSEKRERSCLEVADLRVRVHGSASGRVTGVSFEVGGRPAADDDRPPFRSAIRPRLARTTPRPRVRAVAELVDGRRLTLQRRVRVCR